MAHGLANQVCAFATQNLYMAGAKMLFASPYREAVQAPQSRNYSLPIFSGVNRRGYLSMNYTGAANAGGGGARFDMDGENALGFYWGPWTDAGEIEEQDDRMAQLTLARKLDKNFHGFGKYRGGTPLTEVNTFCASLRHELVGELRQGLVQFRPVRRLRRTAQSALRHPRHRPDGADQGRQGPRPRPIRAARRISRSTATTS